MSELPVEGPTNAVSEDNEYLPSFIDSIEASKEDKFMALVGSIINQPISLVTPRKRKKARPRKNIACQIKDRVFAETSDNATTTHFPGMSDQICVSDNHEPMDNSSSSRFQTDRLNLPPVDKPRKVRKKRHSKKNLLNAIDDLPADITMNFNRWLYGEDYGDIRPKTQQKPDAFKPVIDRYVEKQINFTLDPRRNKYLTENLSREFESLPVEVLRNYRLLMEDQTKNESEESETSSSRATPTNESSTSPKKKKRMAFILEPEHIFIDRRPMLNLNQKVTSIQSSSSQIVTTSLIDPSENCDNDSDLEVPEIDCDVQ